MIRNDADLQQTIEQLERMYRALAVLRAEVAPIKPINYQFLAEGPVEEIRRLRHDIDEYLGIQEAAPAGQA